METLNDGGEDETPLEVKMNGFATIIGKIGLTFEMITFLVLIIRFLVEKALDDEFTEWSSIDAMRLLDFFANALNIIVVVVLERLPLVVTLSLASAMKKLMNDRALVRHLSACETIGSASCICTDRIGTLTTNHMVVDKNPILGTPTEVALLEFSLLLGGDFHSQCREYKIVKVEPFNSVRKKMSVLVSLPNGSLISVLNQAFLICKDRCRF